jgi:hypothetical protein
MDNSRTIRGMIETIVIEQTRYLRHYIGQVVDTGDETNKGMVKVQVAMLGWISPSIAPWCFPRDKRGMIVPKVDDWVEVYFIAGDKNHPVYLGIANEMKDQVTKAYTDTSKDVIFEEDNVSLVYDKTGKKVTITNGSQVVTMDETLKKMTLDNNGKKVIIDSVLGITLSSGDAITWCPNILAVCPIIGVHGGITGGITLLKGA